LEIASDSKPGLDRLASVAFVRGGLVAHDLAEIKRLFSGKKVGINASVSDDALIFSGTTQASDLRDQLSLLCAYLSYPSFRPEALEEFRRSLDPLYNLFRCTASGVLTQSVPRYLTHNDERFGYPEKEVLAQRNFEELSQVLKPILSQGYIEICLVGDLDPATSIEAVAETFGALPTRSPSKERFETCRELRWPSPGDTAKLFSFESEIPKATLQVYWPTEDIWNLSNNRRLNILSELFKNRLIFEIRQALGESYTPQVDSLSSDTFTDRGAIVATLIVDPQKAPALLDKIVDIGHTLATNEIGEDEFRRALNPILTKIKDYLQTNEYWMANLCNVHEYPIKLRWPTTLLSEYTSIQREEVQALAKKYLPRERAIKITLRPKNAPLPSPNSTDKE
jgi:zinc protease